MKTLVLQKRIAAHILKVGQNKIWFDPLMINEIHEAITKADIEALIKEGVIKKRAVKGVKRRAGKLRQIRKRKGRGRGAGKKKKVVNRRKKDYIKRIRKLRSYIKELRSEEKISSKEKNKLMKLAKAGVFKFRKEIKEKLKTKW